jgi:hypothetical protein
MNINGILQKKVCIALNLDLAHLEILHFLKENKYFLFCYEFFSASVEGSDNIDYLETKS